jgi:hydroxymethylbilane synthase
MDARPATRTLRIGTRGSALALVQARWVAARLADHGVASEIVVIRTEGDDRPVDTAWGEGAFVGRIVAALLDGDVDLAVHSAKDVPTDEHPALVIAAYPEREDPRDALVCRMRGTTLESLPVGARVGTDSPRRTAFLRAIRPDLVLHPLHGNVDTRLAKLDRGDSDALVLAVAGLTRLGHADRIDQILPTSLVPSAPGQGSLALQVRAGDDEAITTVGLLDDPATRAAVEAERRLLNATGGGCRSPIGAVGLVRDGRLALAAGAERALTVRPGAPIAPVSVAWVRGDAPVVERRSLAESLAARLVEARQHPRVILARPADRTTTLADVLRDAGIATVHVPAIEIVPAPTGPIDAAFGRSQPGDWIVVTSVPGARAAIEAMARGAIDPRAHRWAAVGRATAASLDAASISDVFVPALEAGEGLGRELPVTSGDRVLLPRGDLADETLPRALRARGAEVEEVVAYRTREAPAGSRAVLAAAYADGPIDALVLTSGSTARGLLALAVGDDLRARVRATPVIAIGRPTAAAAADHGFTTVLISPEPGATPLAAFVAESLGLDSTAHAGPQAADAPHTASAPRANQPTETVPASTGVTS